MTDEQIIEAVADIMFGENKKCGFRNCNLALEVLDLINRQKAEIEHFRKVTKKAKSDLKYYLDTNEENGVVWFPEFTITNIIKELTEKGGESDA